MSVSIQFKAEMDSLVIINELDYAKRIILLKEIIGSLPQDRVDLLFHNLIDIVSPEYKVKIFEKLKLLIEEDKKTDELYKDVQEVRNQMYKNGL